jgi:hypothetical protein
VAAAAEEGGHTPEFGANRPPLTPAFGLANAPYTPGGRNDPAMRARTPSPVSLPKGEVKLHTANPNTILSRKILQTYFQTFESRCASNYSSKQPHSYPE